MSKYILETNELTKVFGKQKAVNNVSLKIEENSVYGLLGPNGAGKSTTLKMITGMLHKTSGEIMFEGHEWSRNDLSDIGALIEMPPLYENLSARENLKVRTLLLGLPDARIDEVLEIVDLKNTGKKKSGQFSLGMKQRLGIAIALLNNPKLLILDEPTNGLDPLGIRTLLNVLREKKESGAAILMSTHVLDTAEKYCDRFIVLHDGLVQAQGDLETLKGEVQIDETSLEDVYFALTTNTGDHHE